jgi:hypothetical protein
MKFILILCFIRAITAHQVWAWMSADESVVLFNQYNWESVEQVCNTVGQGVTDTKTCFTGAPGRKCIGMYKSTNCAFSDESDPGVTFHEYSTYCSGVNQCQYINFDGTAWSTLLDIELALMAPIVGIEIALANDNTHVTGTTFPAFGVKTYNC